MGLPSWDKPASACLSSRIPYGTAIEEAVLQRIDAAEDMLRSLGFSQVRVRHHGDVARIEVSDDEMPLLLEQGASPEDSAAVSGAGLCVHND